MASKVFCKGVILAILAVTSIQAEVNGNEPSVNYNDREKREIRLAEFQNCTGVVLEFHNQIQIFHEINATITSYFNDAFEKTGGEEIINKSIEVYPNIDVNIVRNFTTECFYIISNNPYVTFIKEYNTCLNNPVRPDSIKTQIDTVNDIKIGCELDIKRSQTLCNSKVKKRLSYEVKKITKQIEIYKNEAKQCYDNAKNNVRRSKKTMHLVEGCVHAQIFGTTTDPNCLMNPMNACCKSKSYEIKCELLGNLMQMHTSRCLVH